ncbi:NAD(P)-binding protein [Nemania abortiva]|nr:NAD(P)-binding protein [Nemania abortiva]
MAEKVVLISGANRGIGRGLLETYLAKPNHTVIAANRDPTNASSNSLHSLPVGQGSRLVVVKVDALVETDAAGAVAKLTAGEDAIDRLDLVIANAGIANKYPKVSELKTADFIAHLTPNVLGTIWLFQATLPLLYKSKSPAWVTIGSDAGCIQNLTPFPNSAYSPSKVAVHWLTRKINAEEDKLNAFVVNPGFCQTDLGNMAANLAGLEKAFLPVSEACPQIVKLIDAATKESHGGRFWNYDGKEMAW